MYFHCKVHDMIGIIIAQKNVWYGKVIEKLLAVKKWISQTSIRKRINRENGLDSWYLPYLLLPNKYIVFTGSGQETNTVPQSSPTLLFSKERRKKHPQISLTSWGISMKFSLLCITFVFGKNLFKFRGIWSFPRDTEWLIVIDSLDLTKMLTMLLQNLTFPAFLIFWTFQMAPALISTS